MMDLQMSFPVSGVTTWIFLPPLVAFVVSFFASMGGVSGARLQKHMPQRFIKMMLVVMLLFLAISYIREFFAGWEPVAPDFSYSIAYKTQPQSAMQGDWLSLFV
jgi:hypothetical protein